MENYRFAFWEDVSLYYLRTIATLYKIGTLADIISKFID